LQRKKTRRTQSAGGVVLNSRGDVLVVNQRGLAWSLPKGHLEKGEDALAAARREISEETGISDLTLLAELGSYQRHKLGLHTVDDRSELKTLTFFLFRTNQENLRPADPRHPEARWVAKENVADLLTHPRDKEFFRKILPRLNSNDITPTSILPPRGGGMGGGRIR